MLSYMYSSNMNGAVKMSHTVAELWSNMDVHSYTQL